MKRPPASILSAAKSASGGSSFISQIRHSFSVGGLHPLQGLVPPSGGTRFPALDGLRGLACLAVAAGHLHLLYPRMNEGFSGGAVAVFYVLSAFLLSYPWFIGKPIKPGSYYIRRLFRIWPAYLVSLLLSLWLYATLNSPLPSAVKKCGTRQSPCELWKAAVVEIRAFGHRLKSSLCPRDCALLPSSRNFRSAHRTACNCPAHICMGG